MHKKLLITYDYELYLGNRSGNVKDCMIQPTIRLMEVMRQYGIRAVFFVDTTYLLQLKAMAANYPACQTDFNTVADQLRDLVKNGHFVFPHIHPHWLDAQYLPDINEWRLNNISRYRFHDLAAEDRAMIFDGSMQLLNDILLPNFPEYKVNGYRAGGWCIQPFSDFIDFFKKHEIRYEFSVLSGIYQFTGAQFFDFSSAPKKNIYRFQDDICIESRDGQFIEYNISTLDISGMRYFWNKVWIKALHKIMGDHTFLKGEGQPLRIIHDVKPMSPEGHDLSTPGKERICIELMSSVKLNSYLKFLEAHPYMHFISHPKMVTGHNLAVFNKFLQKAFEKYSIETDFHKMLPE